MAKSKNEKSLREGYAPLPGSERRPSKIAKVLGPADENETFRVTIVLRRRTDGPPVPDFEYYAITPPEQRQRMPAEEFAAKYGAHPDDIAQVVKFVQGAGLKVIETQPVRRTIAVSGTVSAMSKAFAVELATYEHTFIRDRKRPRPVKRTYRGMNGFVHVPEELLSIIIGVFGLDNRKIGHRAGTGDPAITNPLTITEIMTAYNFPTPGPTITGQTIGVVALTGDSGGYLQSDMDLFFGPLGITNKIIPVSVDSYTNPAFSVLTTAVTAIGQSTLTLASFAGIYENAGGQLTIGGIVYYFDIPTKPTSNIVTVELYEFPTGFPVVVPAGTVVYFNLDGETNQDICICGGAAAGANVAVYFSEDTESGWVDLIHQAIHPNPGDLPSGVNPPSILTSSWSIAPGDDPDGLTFGDTYWGTGITLSLINTMTLAFQDAAINALTVCIDTDDYGSNMLAGNIASSGSPIDGDGYAHVVYPATDPWVLAVGGTTLGKYLPGGSTTPEWVEYVWNDPNPETTGIWGTGGGGISDLFPVPSYQAGAGLPVSINTTYTPTDPSVTPPAPFNKTGRGTPDVAGNASINSGYSGIYQGGSPTIGNGTSASTPLWAGLIGLLNSNLGYNVGFINPLLYQWGTGLFSPINPLWPDPAFPQLANCPPDNSNNGIPGYTAGPGWDACTGLGSPNGTALLQKFYELGQAFIYGGYQSADIILFGPDPSDPLLNKQIPIGGAPGGPWDTLLVPGADYAFSAQIHNSSSTQAAYVDAISFWAIPGGVGTTGGTLLDTVPVAQSILPGGSITVDSTQPFVNPGSHMCAVVSIYSTASGWTFNGAADPKSQDIPNPGATGSHSGSAWRNTDSSTGGAGGRYKIKLGFERIPAPLPEPVVLHIQATHVPQNWNNEPKVRQIQTILDMAGAESNLPLFLLPEFISTYPLLHLKNEVGQIEGGKIHEGKDEKWYITPESKADATSFVVTGEIPAAAKKGDIIVVNVTANYPKTKETEARAVGFQQFIYVK
jgi:hypothetical protein